MSSKSTIKKTIDSRPDITVSAIMPEQTPDIHRLSRRREWFPTLAVIAFGLTAIIALFWESAEGAVYVWYHSRTFNHGFIIIPISAYLIWQKREVLRTMSPEPWNFAAILAVPVAILWLGAEALGVLEVKQFATLTIIQLLILAAIGRRVFMEILFPLIYLYFLVPSGDFLVPKLQEWTAAFIVAGLTLADIPVFSDGVFILIPTGTFEVAEACAGLRFLIASLAFGALFAYVAYRNFWLRAAFIALSIVIPLFANGLRGLGIILLAYISNNRIAADIDHIVYGWVFFSAVLLALALIGLRFRQDDVEAAPSPSVALTVNGTVGARAILAAFAVVFVAAAPRAYAETLMTRAAAYPMYRLVPPPTAPGWTTITGRDPDWRPMFRGADGELLQAYSHDGASVLLYVAYYAWQRWGAKLTSGQNRFTGDNDWRLVERDRATIIHNGQLLTVSVHRLMFGQRERLVYYWYWVDGRATADPAMVKLLLAKAFFTDKAQHSAVLAIAVNVEPGGPLPLRIVQKFVEDFESLDRIFAPPE